VWSSDPVWLMWLVVFFIFISHCILACIFLPAEVLSMLTEAAWVAKYQFQ